MPTKKHIYSFSYHNTESDLCKLESKYLFHEEEKNKLLFSDIKIAPSISAFVKSRLDVISFSDNYPALIKKIKSEKICIEDFKVEYLVFDNDKTEYRERLKKLKDIGFSIEGIPDYHNPIQTFAICLHEGRWYFGVLIKDDFTWHKHRQKPHSYSNSISASVAKVLINISAKRGENTEILDACCGVGTIILEACFSEISIEGCDINKKIAQNARENISHFDYSANVYHSDIKNISKRYQAVIIDLPYNLFSNVTDAEIINIIESSAEITDRIVIASIADITQLIHNAGFIISDYCSIGKSGKRKFTRKIWVCDKTTKS